MPISPPPIILYSLLMWKRNPWFLARHKATFSSFFAARCGHVLKFWPMRCKQNGYVRLLGIVPVGRWHSLFCLFFPDGWNVNMMAGSRAAILDHEVEAVQQRWRRRKIGA